MYNINQVRQALQANIGKQVMLRAVKGRKRYTVPCCTIEQTYPGIFVIKTTDAVTSREKLISYSYSDILTGTIEIRLLRAGGNDNAHGEEVS